MTARQYIENDAVISACGRYRYLLRRTWNAASPRALYVMLNPSTADALQDDPTIRSCVRLAAGLGYGSLEVVNVFAYRATKPDALLSAADPVGLQNETHVRAALARCDVPILAWGAWPPARAASIYVRNAIRASRPAAFCFGKTASGAPKHPLYIKSGTPLENYGC
jgi:hypothetical protein